MVKKVKDKKPVAAEKAAAPEESKIIEKGEEENPEAANTTKPSDETIGE